MTSSQATSRPRIPRRGAAESAPFGKVTLDAWRRAMAVNLDALFLVTQAALPDLRAAEHGRVVTIASTAGLKGYGYTAPYVAAKHGAIGFTRALAAEFAKSSLTVNAVCPGFAKSAMTDPFAADLEASGIPLIPAEVVAETVVRLFALDVAGECWFVQPGREPAPFAFRNIPGPRAAVSTEEA